MTKRSMAAAEAEIETEAETASKREGDAEGKKLVSDELVKKKKKRALISDEGENTEVSTVATNCAQEQRIVNCQADHGVAILDEGGRRRRSPNKTQNHVKAPFDKLAPIERKYCHRCSRSTTRESNAGSQSIAKENEEESGGNLLVGNKKIRAVSSAGAGPESPQQQLIMCCQADNCNADLLEAKRYHQKHRVCESHAKAAMVLVGETEQRYCQQCSRFHELSEFDNNKRSCRKRLAHHNERRRKGAPPEPETKEDPERLPSVVKVKENSWRVITVSEDGGNSEVIKIALPKSPSLKHFQIR